MGWISDKWKEFHWKYLGGREEFLRKMEITRKRREKIKEDKS